LCVTSHHGVTMNHWKWMLVLSMSAGLFLWALAGCSSGDHTQKAATPEYTKAAQNPTSMPAHVQNKETAKEMLQEAEKAEADGRYAHALELYQYLQGFPKESRPGDIEQRVKRVEQKMQTGGGR
jgi:hypothetical protein